jgi:DNA repair exonuclease SbcCD ATPase subunit
MRVKRLHAHNYRQHKDVEFEPEGNVIAIVGENGAGKSNLVTSMRYGLEGSVPKVNKDSLLQWGQKSGFVELDIEHDNDLVKIHRGLGGAKTWSQLNDEDKVMGINPTNRALQRWIGFDKSVGDIVFVAQNELDEVLFADPSVRKMSFNRMCGLGDTAKIHRELLPLIQANVPDNSDIDAKIETMKTHVAELMEAEAKAEREYQELRNRKQTSDPDALRRSAAEIDTLLSNLNEYKRAKARLGDLLLQAEAAKGAMEEASAHPLANKNITQAEDMLADTNYRLSQITEIATLRTKYDQALHAYNSIPPGSVDPQYMESLKQEIDDIKDMISHNTGSAQNLKKYLEAMAHSDEHGDQCPLCQSPVDTTMLKQSLEAQVATLESTIAELQVKQSEAQETLSNLQATEARESQAMQTAQRNLDMAKSAYEAKAGDQDTSTEAVQALHTKKSKLEQLIADIRTAANAKIQATSHWQAAESAHVAAVGQVERLASLLPGVTLDTIDDLIASKVEEQAAYRRQADTISAENARLEVLSNAMADATLSCQTAKSRLQALENERDTLGCSKQILEVLTDVREWFHYENGPAQIAKRVLNGMNSDVQTFLAQLDAPFTAEAVSSDLTYRCMFSDGRLAPPDGWTSVADLSGGEKALMAVAFRLASYVTFAAKQGVLVLDEPTANWDNVNVRNFCELLERLRTLAKALGLQIFVITHHHDCLAAVDSHLRLERS